MMKSRIMGIALSLVVVAASIGATAFADGWGSNNGPNANWRGHGNNPQYGQSGNSDGQDRGRGNGDNWGGGRGQSNGCSMGRGGRHSNRSSGYDARQGRGRGRFGSDRSGRNRVADQGWGDRQGRNNGGWGGNGRWNDSQRGQDGRGGCGNGNAGYGR